MNMFSNVFDDFEQCCDRLYNVDSIEEFSPLVQESLEDLYNLAKLFTERYEEISCS